MPQPSQKALDLLKANPDKWQDFKEKFGSLPDGFTPPAAPQRALDMLAANPDKIGDFEAKFGYRPAAHAPAPAAPAAATNDQVPDVDPETGAPLTDRGKQITDLAASKAPTLNDLPSLEDLGTSARGGVADAIIGLQRNATKADQIKATIGGDMRQQNAAYDASLETADPLPPPTGNREDAYFYGSAAQRRALQSDPEFLARQQKLEQLQGASQEIQKDQSAAAERNPSLLGRSTLSAAASLPQSAAALAVGIGTGNPALAAASMGPATFGQTYNQLTDAGVEHHKATGGGLIDAGLEVGTELLPFTALLKHDKTATAKLTHFLAGELPGESIATITQTLNQYLQTRKDDVTFGDVVEGLKQGTADLPQTWLSTLLTGGVQSGTVSAAQSLAKPRGRKGTAIEFANDGLDALNQETRRSLESSLVQQDALTASALSDSARPPHFWDDVAAEMVPGGSASAGAVAAQRTYAATYGRALASTSSKKMPQSLAVKYAQQQAEKASTDVTNLAAGLIEGSATENARVRASLAELPEGTLDSIPAYKAAAEKTDNPEEALHEALQDPGFAYSVAYATVNGLDGKSFDQFIRQQTGAPSVAVPVSAPTTPEVPNEVAQAESAKQEPKANAEAEQAKPSLSDVDTQRLDHLEQVATAAPIEPAQFQTLVNAGLAKVTQSGKPILTPAGRRARVDLQNKQAQAVAAKEAAAKAPQSEVAPKKTIEAAPAASEAKAPAAAAAEAPAAPAKKTATLSLKPDRKAARTEKVTQEISKELQKDLDFSARETAEKKKASQLERQKAADVKRAAAERADEEVKKAKFAPGVDEPNTSAMEDAVTAAKQKAETSRAAEEKKQADEMTEISDLESVVAGKATAGQVGRLSARGLVSKNTDGTGKLLPAGRRRMLELRKVPTRTEKDETRKAQKAGKVRIEESEDGFTIVSPTGEPVATVKTRAQADDLVANLPTETVKAPKRVKRAKPRGTLKTPSGEPILAGAKPGDAEGTGAVFARSVAPDAAITEESGKTFVRLGHQNNSLRARLKNGAYHIEMIHVDPSERGKGSATAMYEKLLSRGLPVKSDVSGVSADARKIYGSLRKLGYEVIQDPDTVIDSDGKAMAPGRPAFVVMPKSEAARSIPASKALKGIPRAELDKVVTDIGAELNVRIRIADSDTDPNIPTYIRDELERVAGTQGLFYKSPTGETEVWLIRENLADRKTAIEVAIHEAVGHLGLRAMLGPERYNSTMRQIRKSFPREVRSRAVRNKIKWDSKNRDVQERRRNLAAEELVAYATARSLTLKPNARALSVWDRIVDFFRNAARSAGLLKSFSVKDVDRLILRARDYVRDSMGAGFNAQTEYEAEMSAAQVTNPKMQFKHFSNLNGEEVELDPAFQGTGFKGRESLRKGPQVTSLYPADLSDAEVEKELQGKTKYVVEIPRDSLYDASEDKLGLRQKAQKAVGWTEEDGVRVPNRFIFDMNRFEELIRDAGFTGYYTPAASGILRGQGRLFHATRARRADVAARVDSGVTHFVNGNIHTVSVQGGGSMTAEAMPERGMLWVKSANVPADQRGSGLGVAMAQRLASEAYAMGLQLVSDNRVSDNAARVYESLARRGYSVKRNPARLDRGTGELISASELRPVFEVTGGELAASVGLVDKSILPKIASVGDFRSSTIKAFMAAQTKARQLMPAQDREQVSPIPLDFKGDVYLSKGGLAGFGVASDGELVGVFKNPESKSKDVMGAVMRAGKTAGATHLNAFDTYLVKAYTKRGARETSREKFNPEFAPSNWDVKSMGKPDYVSMSMAEVPSEKRVTRKKPSPSKVAAQNGQQLDGLAGTEADSDQRGDQGEKIAPLEGDRKRLSEAAARVASEFEDDSEDADTEEEESDIAYAILPGNTGDPVLDSFLDKFEAPGKTLRQHWDNWTAGIVGRSEEEVLDDLAGIKNTAEDAGIDITDSGFKNAHLARSAAELTTAVLEHGPPLWIKEGTHEVAGVDSRQLSFLQILKPLGSNVDLWGRYMVAKRAQFLKSQGRENLFTDAEINKGLALGAGHPEFDVAAAAYAALNKKVLDFAEYAGRIDPAARALWENQNYIPFYRVSDAMANRGGSVFGPLGNLSKAIQQLRGGKANLGDPIENIVKNWYSLLDGALKAHAARTVVDAFDGTGLVVREPMMLAPVIVPMAQVKQWMQQNPRVAALLYANGIDVQLLPASAFAGIQQMFSVQPPNDPEVVNVWRNGKREYWRVNDEPLLRGLMSIPHTTWGPWMEIFRLPKRIFTATTTSTPQFQFFSNPIRDMLHSFVVGAVGRDTTVLPIIDTAKGVLSQLKQDQDAVDLLAAGGSFTHGYVSGGQDKSAAASYIRRTLKQRTTAGKILETPAQLWRMYRELGNAFENSNRVAIYKKMRASGASRLDSAYEARDVLDFAKRGSNGFIRFLVESAPFWNARLQGLYRIGRSPGGKKKVMIGLAIRGMLLTTITLGLGMLFGNDDRYKALNSADKALYWNFWVGEKHFKIPKPFEVGSIFGTVPEVMMDYFVANAKEPDRAKQAAAMIGFTATQSLNMTPQIQSVMPLVELAMNYDTFSERPILTTHDLAMLPSEQDSPTVHSTYRLLSHLAPELGPNIFQSPKQLQHLGRGYIGGIQDYIMVASDMLARKALGEPEPAAPGGSDIPGLRTIFTDGPPRNTKYTNTMYTVAERAARLSASIDAATELSSESGDARVEKLEKENPALIDVADDFKKALKEVRKLQSDQRDVQLDPSMSPEDKRKELDQSQSEINDIAKGLYDLRPGGKLNPETASLLIGAPEKEQLRILEKEGLPATAKLLREYKVA
jgi:GNAT superfamily N-acetyltransferase